MLRQHFDLLEPFPKRNSRGIVLPPDPSRWLVHPAQIFLKKCEKLSLKNRENRRTKNTIDGLPIKAIAVESFLLFPPE